MSKRGMKVQFEFDCFGNLIMRPIAKVWNDRIQDHCVGMVAIGCSEWKDKLYLTSSDEIEKAVKLVTGDRWKELRDGFVVVCIVDPDEFLKFVGYEANKIIDGDDELLDKRRVGSVIGALKDRYGGSWSYVDGVWFSGNGWYVKKMSFQNQDGTIELRYYRSDSGDRLIFLEK